MPLNVISRYVVFLLKSSLKEEVSRLKEVRLIFWAVILLPTNMHPLQFLYNILDLWMPVTIREKLAVNYCPI